MKNIYTLIEKCGLGTIEGEILPVSGGLMHKMFKVQTTTGIYAVKFLNPEIMKRPSAMGNFLEAERLERILEDNEIPIVAALPFNDKKMVSVNGQYYYVFPWLEGKITNTNAITSEQSFKVGEILGRIHSIDTVSSKELALSEIDFESLLARGAPLLEENISLLEDAQNKLNEARKKLPAISVISNDDMDPKNIIWEDGKAYVIDLECLGYSNPVSSCLNLSLQWAINDKFNKDHLEAFFKGYLSIYDNGFRSYDEVFGIAYTWIEWLEYNIKRTSSAEEIKLGEIETVNTINKIKYLASVEDEIRLALKQIQEKL